MQNKKYNIGYQVEINTIPDDEMPLAISEWSEGNEKLKEAISQCIENGIPTIASCAGHSFLDSPYIAMSINEENVGNILNLIDKFSSISNTSLNLSFKDGISSLAIYANMMNRNKVFETIAEQAENSIEFEVTNDITQSLWNAYSSLRENRGMLGDLDCSIEYRNGRFRNSLLIRQYCYDNILKDILKENMKIKKDIVGNDVMSKISFGNKKIREVLNNITKKVSEEFAEVSANPLKNELEHVIVDLSMQDNNLTKGNEENKKEHKETNGREDDL